MSNRVPHRRDPRPRARILRWSVAAAAAALLVGAIGAVQAAAELPGQSAGNDWPEYLHDSSASGFTGETLITPANAASLRAKKGWPVHLSNAAVCPKGHHCRNVIASQPIVATVGRIRLVYVGSWNGSEYALCATSCTVRGRTYTSGQVVWSTYLGRTRGCAGSVLGVSSAVASATILVSGAFEQVVYVAGGGDLTPSGSVIPGATSKFFALDAISGAVLWQTSLGSAPSHYMWSSPVLANDSIYVGMASPGDCPPVRGEVIQLNPSTGRVMHAFAVVPSRCIGGGVWGSAAVDSSGNVYVATGNQGSCPTSERNAVALLKLSSTLTLLSSWQVPAAEQVPDGDFGSTPTLFNGTATSGGRQQSLLGLSNKNGVYYVFNRSTISRGPVVRLRVAAGGGCPECGQGSISPSSWDGRFLYVAGGTTSIKGVSYQGSLRAFSPNHLVAPIWQLGFSAPVLGAVSTVAGLAVVGQGGYTTLVKSASGSVAFLGAGHTFYAAPSIAHGVIYEGDTSGVVHAYSVKGQ